MNTLFRRLLLVGVIVVLCLVSVFVWYERRGYAADYEYEYGRPLATGEQTYTSYRRMHADEAAQRDPTTDRDAVQRGMDTWYWWTGGNQAFWRDVAILTAGHSTQVNLPIRLKKTGLPVKVDLLSLLHKVPRLQRFEVIGTINDPDCVAAEKPDQYGLMIDRMKQGTMDYNADDYGWSSGIIGLRLFTNKKFDPKLWSLGKYLDDPGSVEPPYTVGMACAICHVAFNPSKPPKDPTEPAWENLASMIGNQFFREGQLFGLDVGQNQFIWQYAHNQPLGTSETSRFDTDFINNPNAINSVYRLKARLKLAAAEEVTPTQKTFLEAMNLNMGLAKDTDLGGTDDKPTHLTPHVLKDGADSMGVPVASLRVWVNIGMMHQDWVKCWAINPFDLDASIRRGFVQQPFAIAAARANPTSWWMQTEKRMVDLEKFALTFDSYPLKDAPGGSEYLKATKETLDKGKIAFAENCARCHSSKQPKVLPADEEGQKKAWRELVLSDDFLEANYLSDDKRYPVSELHTNAARALGSNALAGHIWDNFSSQTYKNQPNARGQLRDEDAQGNLRDLYNPLTKQYDIKFTVPDDRVASYRTPSLVSIWATAPYLHNNSVGIVCQSPAVADRIAGFEDGMSKLLWPERRLGIDSVKVTTSDSRLPDLFDLLSAKLPVPIHPDLHVDLLQVEKGTPIDLLADFQPTDLKVVLEAYVQGVLQGQPRDKFGLLRGVNHKLGHRKMLEKLLELSPCPDFIQDKGHTYGSKLPDDQKLALIEFLKTF